MRRTRAPLGALAAATLALTLALLIPIESLAREATGAGASMGAGATAYDTGPGFGFELALPALELALGLKQPGLWQLRVRLPILNTVYAAAIRQQLDLRLDVLLLATPCDCAIGDHMIRPVLGPWVGARLQAAGSVAQPGAAVGGRFGAEYVGPARRIGLTLAVEPYFQVQGGPAGANRSLVTAGGGALVVLALTGYQAP